MKQTHITLSYMRDITDHMGRVNEGTPLCACPALVAVTTDEGVILCGHGSNGYGINFHDDTVMSVKEIG